MDNTIKFKGAEGFYRSEGKGKVVMLVHGFMEEGSMWKGLGRRLSTKYKVIMPDLPGFGQSALIAEPLSMELYAEFLRAICKKEEVSSFILLGHSMGGYVTLAFAQKYPKLLAGFGLLNSHCYEDGAEKKTNRRKTIDFIKKHGTAHFVRELYDTIFEEGYKKKHPEVVKPMVEKALKYTPKAVIAATQAMINRKDKSAVLEKSKVPVLMINGKQDVVVTKQQALDQASLADITDFHLIDESKHMTIFEKRARATKAIEEFLERSYQ